MTPEQQKEQERKEAALDAEQLKAREQIVEFLALPSIQEALRRIDKAYFDEFKAATTAEQREIAWAKSNCMQEFLNELAGIQNRGLIAGKRIDDREAANARLQRNTRKS